VAAKTPPRFSYDYPRPALTVDVAIVTREDRPRVLLIRRKKEPFAGSWALPGGFVDENERLADAARISGSIQLFQIRNLGPCLLL